MINIDYDKQEREFAPLVGRAILNFGEIEFCILEAAEILLNEAIWEKAAKLTFKARTKLIIKNLSGWGKKGEAATRLIHLLEKAISLAEKRNIIAHNPLQIEISYDKDVCNHTPKICKYLDREKKVTKENLIDFCNSVETLAGELNDTIHEALVEACKKPT